jgi:hypothetical protein
MRKLLFVLAGLASVTLIMSGLSIAASTGSMFVGSKVDIAGVTASLHKSDPDVKVGGVHVAGDYALLQLYFVPEGSGVAIYKRTSDEQWKPITKGGGGALGGTVTSFGVPASIAKQLCSGWPDGQSPCGNVMQ